VLHTLAALAEIRGEAPDELARRIDENATAAFGLGQR
jgi:Tat protein secretion system quality control protein TatD with DNase activity